MQQQQQHFSENKGHKTEAKVVMVDQENVAVNSHLPGADEVKSGLPQTSENRVDLKHQPISSNNPKDDSDPDQNQQESQKFGRYSNPNVSVNEYLENAVKSYCENGSRFPLQTERFYGNARLASCQPVDCRVSRGSDGVTSLADSPDSEIKSQE